MRTKPKKARTWLKWAPLTLLAKVLPCIHIVSPFWATVILFPTIPLYHAPEHPSSLNGSGALPDNPRIRSLPGTWSSSCCGWWFRSCCNCRPGHHTWNLKTKVAGQAMLAVRVTSRRTKGFSREPRERKRRKHYEHHLPPRSYFKTAAGC